MFKEKIIKNFVTTCTCSTHEAKFSAKWIFREVDFPRNKSVPRNFLEITICDGFVFDCKTENACVPLIMVDYGAYAAS